MDLRPLVSGIFWAIASYAGLNFATLAGIASFVSIASMLGCDVRSVVPLPDSCGGVYYFVLSLAALVGGVGLGVVQFAALRLLQVPTSALWVPVTSLGLAIPVAVGLRILGSPSAAGGITFFILLGLSLGSAQWLILRARISGSAIWIIGNLASAIIAGLLSKWTVGSTLSWAVVSVGSALTLIWLLRSGRPLKPGNAAG